MFINIPSLINLSFVNGVGSIRLRALVGRFKDAEKIFNAPLTELTDVDGIDQKTALQIRAYKEFDYGNKQCELLSQVNGRAITFWDSDYPALLKRIYDPPAILFVKGTFVESDALAIAIVGTRAPSSYGKMVTETFAKQLGQYGITIVSGLARGVDTTAHWTALRSGARTIAVLGTGLDKIYPSENHKLADEIAEHGAIVTEFHCGVGPEAVNFPRRNRIIAGLSRGTLVTEAGEKSGALITAAFAVDNNRDVYAIPGNISSGKSNGCHKLIRDGATLVTTVDEIIEETVPELKRGASLRAVEPINISDDEKCVISHLSGEPLHIDMLARKMDKATHEILATLLSLEFNDYVKQLPGKYFLLTSTGMNIHGE
jgi:DNA processing protein